MEFNFFIIPFLTFFLFNILSGKWGVSMGEIYVKGFFFFFLVGNFKFQPLITKKKKIIY